MDPNFTELLRTVPNSDGGVDYLMNSGLIVLQSTCISCGNQLSKHKIRTRDGFQLRCTKKDCRKTYSIRRNSWFSRIYLGLDIIIYLIYMWCYEYTVKQVKHELRLANHTIARLFEMLVEFTSKVSPKQNKLVVKM